ncbi:hypothetical protein BABINDRAFT_180101 [Babjeviella inositovora NRRL Y-12698]|uniref:RNA helicase n=1 Tax=Babjeviella inositovora NRRL Y-12698 TaxID=984486 RepID=A0A1E3QR09_9ASCO|nr:uncharacterized protein BABINDRAFT_180101 [Babjeviella inositovora NRRL Y-12698]ODQ80133.1 hypothetical protein BABINDRAFT_180101 [Babjeviella inositovora NRRL Y-12698]
MDIFKILSRGVSLKGSKQATTGFSTAKTKPVETVKKNENMDHQVDKELDFFHTKKHAPVKKEQKADEAVDEEEVVPPPMITTEADAVALRKSYRGKATGDDIPLPIGSFEDLIDRFQLDKKLLSNLIESGFTEPTAIQSESIPITLLNRDLLACAPTGSGKTLAFLIPLIQQLQTNKKNHGIRGLIISPTKELAQQIYDELERLTKGKKLQIGILSKSLAGKLKNKIVQSSKFDILISTPLRLIDTVKEEAMDLSKVEHLIFDEADKLFDQGFLEQTDDILAECSNPKLRKSMFSATIPSGVEDTANSIMHSPVRIIIGHKEAANSTIQQKLVYTGNEEGKLIAVRQMIQEGEFKPPIIIFLQSITRAKALFHELLYDRLNVDVIHAERTPAQRQMVIDRFKSGEIWVLICTDVIARGIDFKGVNMVINYDVPQSAQAYVHRIGRTGRGGKEGRAVTFFTKEDSVAVKSVINVMKQSGQEDGYGLWMENMTKLSKREKQSNKQKPVERKKISTVPSVIKNKRKQRGEMIEASKKRKAEGSKVERSKFDGSKVEG